MVPLDTPPSEEARSIFADLGYDVSGDGDRFRAARGWKEVEVYAVTDDVETADGGRMRCYVTWEEQAPDLRRALANSEPGFEWAVIGVQSDGDYEVARAPKTPEV